MTQVSASPADPPGPVGQAESGTAGPADGIGNAGPAGQAAAIDHADLLTPPRRVQSTGVLEPSRGLKQRGPTEPSGPVERVMSTVIRKLSWSRLSDPRIAVAVSAIGLLFGMVVGATAPNSQTLEYVKLPLTRLASWLLHHPQQTAVPGLHDIITSTVLYSGDILACLGLAGMLWAHSQGWRPDPRRLLLVSTVVVAVMVCLTPVGSSDTASYAAYGRLAALGRDPYSPNALHWLALHDQSYMRVVGFQWTRQPSVYGPVATWIQSLAASIGGPSVQTTIWALMILNGIVFLAVGLLLLKTSDDPLRATLFWTANPVLIQQLVGGGHFDTFVAAAAIAAIQLARRAKGAWADVLIGVLIGLGCGVKITAVLVALGLAWPLLRRREYARLARIALAVMATVAFEYSFYGLDALKPLFGGSQWVTLPSPWWFLQIIGKHLFGVSKTGMALPISILWLVCMFVVAWLVYQRISAEQPREVVAPFALTFAWVVVSPWVFAWYTALPWVALTQVPRNRMTRWLTITTVVLALWHSSGGWVPPGRV